MIKKISESNVFPKFDLFGEYFKIEYLLSEKPTIALSDSENKPYPSLTIEQYINSQCFLDWNLRGTFLSIGEMRECLGISKHHISQKKLSTDTVLRFIQYALNCNFRAESMITHSKYVIDKNYFHVLLNNMTALLEKVSANYSIDNDTSEIFIIYNDELASATAEEYPEIKISLMEYRKIDHKGNLIRKSEILCTLYKKLESMRKKFKGTTYNKLYSDTTFLFNKIGIRHQIEQNILADKRFSEISKEEIEVWYDKAYTMLISCIAISQYLDIEKNISDIKQIYANSSGSSTSS